MSAQVALAGEARFLQIVGGALKGDHNDLRREQMILRAHRAAIAEVLQPFLLLPEHGEVDDRSRGYNQAVAKVHQLAARMFDSFADLKEPASAESETSRNSTQ